MVMRVVGKGNGNGSALVVIPAVYAKKLGIVPGDYVNFEQAGNTLHLTKVVIEGI